MEKATAPSSTISIYEERISGHLELLSTMGQDFATSLDIDETLRHGLERITDYVGAEMAENMERVLGRGMKILGTFNQHMPNNWKLYMENVLTIQA